MGFNIKFPGGYIGTKSAGVGLGPFSASSGYGGKKGGRRSGGAVRPEPTKTQLRESALSNLFEMIRLSQVNHQPLPWVSGMSSRSDKQLFVAIDHREWAEASRIWLNVYQRAHGSTKSNLADVDAFAKREVRALKKAGRSAVKDRAAELKRGQREGQKALKNEKKRRKSERSAAQVALVAARARAASQPSREASAPPPPAAWQPLPQMPPPPTATDRIARQAPPPPPPVRMDPPPPDPRDRIER